MINGVSASNGVKEMPLMSKSSIITKEFPSMPSNKIAPIHPGEILLEEFLQPLKLSQYRLAKDLSVSPRRINEIVHGKRAITADSALRLARYFETTDRFWINLQTRYDLEIEKDRLGAKLETEVQILNRSEQESELALADS
jgi:addiction module HigA family antidote|tara:strand:+ start:1040 stop:1462 length:423 start_codon:yes stop_codon:yes gene_type:complete